MAPYAILLIEYGCFLDAAFPKLQMSLAKECGPTFSMFSLTARVVRQSFSLLWRMNWTTSFT